MEINDCVLSIGNYRIRLHIIDTMYYDEDKKTLLIEYYNGKELLLKNISYNEFYDIQKKQIDCIKLKKRMYLK